MALRYHQRGVFAEFGDGKLRKTLTLLLKAMERTTWLSAPRDKPKTMLQD